MKKRKRCTVDWSLVYIENGLDMNVYDRIQREKTMFVPFSASKTERKKDAGE